jgi:hypothetical protein
MGMYFVCPSRYNSIIKMCELENLPSFQLMPAICLSGFLDPFRVCGEGDKRQIELWFLIWRFQGHRTILSFHRLCILGFDVWSSAESRPGLEV